MIVFISYSNIVWSVDDMLDINFFFLVFENG